MRGTMKSQALWKALGVASVLPVVIPLGAVALGLKLQPFVALAGTMSLLVSACFLVVGFRAGTRWLLIWGISFLILMPFSNPAFWLVHRHGVSKPFAPRSASP